MRFFQLLSRLSIIGLFLVTIQIIFFEQYFSPITNRALLIIGTVFFVIFPIAEFLKKRAKKKHENKQY